MTSCTSAALTSMKPAVVVAADRSASAAGSCCAAKAYDEEMEMRADCVDWTRGAIAAAATELRDAATAWHDATASRDAATALFLHGIRSAVAAYAAANGLPPRRKRSTLERRAGVARDFRTRNRAVKHLYD